MTQSSRKLTIRPMHTADIAALVPLTKAIYGKDYTTRAEFISRLRHFAPGQFVAMYGDQVVGYCGTFIIDKAAALAPHTYDEITANGHAARHNPKGQVLYGMEVCVDPAYRNLRIGQRFYNARKQLCQDLNLQGIVCAGRLPGLQKKWQQCGGDPQTYIRKVERKEWRDSTLGFQLRNGFEVVGVLDHYLPQDKESKAYAAHLMWRNPLYDEEKGGPNLAVNRTTVRLAAVQFQARKVSGFKEFAAQVEYFVNVAADYRADFVLFPEFVTMPLLSAEEKSLNAREAIELITEYTDEYVATMQQMAISYNINIIGGSHPTKNGSTIENIAYIFLRDGTVHQQGKLHPTPSEREAWGIQGTKSLQAIDTDCGPIGVLICYDSEFPEAARYLTDQGAQILFVPFCTDQRQGYNRVRYCAQARAVENQQYVVMAGLVGNLPDVEQLDIHYAESCILTPCDFPFARDGIAETSAPNTEMVIFADVRLDDLNVARHSGTVQNLKDRRFDLYRVAWKK